jgi:predicted nuclease with TOPRIM domain
VACAKTSTNGCNSNNVEEKFQCIRKENFLLEKELKKLKTMKERFYPMEKNIENRCESKKSYTLGRVLDW